MKHDPSHAKALTALIARLKKKYEVEEPLPADPTTQLVISFLQWGASAHRAEQAIEAIMACVIDLNELRISYPEQIMAMIGTDYPCAEERVIRLRETMNEVFKREHDWHLKSLPAKNKKDQRAYLETLPGITPYVVSHMMLVAFGGHAMPVDEKLAMLLADKGCCDAEASPVAVESFLLRQIKAGDALDTHLLFQAWSDASRKTVATSKKNTVVKKTAPKKAAKKSSSQKKKK